MTREEHVREFEEDWFRAVPVSKGTFEDVAKVTRYPVKTIRNQSSLGLVKSEGEGSDRRFDWREVEQWVWLRKTRSH